MRVAHLLTLAYTAGCRLRAYFCGSENPADCGVSGWRDVARCGPFNRQGAALHFLRRWHVRCCTAENTRLCHRAELSINWSSALVIL